MGKQVAYRVLGAILVAACLPRCHAEKCLCVSNEVNLTVPESCGRKILMATTEGPACDGAGVRREDDRISIQPIAEGACLIRLRFEDGWVFETEATIQMSGSSGCCEGLYPIPEHRDFAVGYPGFCGACDKRPDHDCFTLPSFDDCLCRCAGGAVLTTYAMSGCLRACACGFGDQDLTTGCVTNSDCVLAPVDCCPYGRQRSMAMHRQHSDSWLTSMTLQCDGVDAGCDSRYPSGAAACQGGRCLVDSRVDAGM